MCHVKSNRYAVMHLIYAIIYTQKDFKHFQGKIVDMSEIKSHFTGMENILLNFPVFIFFKL